MALAIFFCLLSVCCRFVAPDLVNLQVLGCSVADREAHGGCELLPSVVSCRTGVEVQKVVRAVRHRLQYMGVSAYKQSGAVRCDQRLSARGVVAWVAADMNHADFQPLNCKNQLFRTFQPDVTSVDVAAYRPQRLERPQSLKCFQVPNVARMP